MIQIRFYLSLIMILCCTIAYSQTNEEEPIIEEVIIDDSSAQIVRQRQNNLYGFKRNSEWLIQAKYESLARQYSDAMIASKDGKYGVINKNEEVVIPFIYDELIHWNAQIFDGSKKRYYVVTQNGLKGILRHDGSSSIPIKYTTLRFFYDNVLNIGAKNIGYGLCTVENDIIVPLNYDESFRFKSKAEQEFIVKKGGKLGIININEEVLLPFEYEDIEKKSIPANQYLYFKKNGKWGIMDFDWNVIQEPKYDEIENRQDPFTRVKNNGSYGILNEQFKEIIPPIYADARPYANHLHVKVETKPPFPKYGIIDAKGVIILEPVFHRNIIRVNNGDFYIARKFSIQNDQPYYFYDKNGVLKDKVPYTYAQIVGDCVILGISTETRKLGIMNSKGAMIADFKYDAIARDYDNKYNEDEWFVAERDGKKGYLSKDGKEMGEWKME